MDVNEKIVAAWLQWVKNIFVIQDIDYGLFHSNIDILGISPEKKEIYDIEVKYRPSVTINAKVKKKDGYEHLKEQLISGERDKEISKRIPKTLNFKVIKVLICPKSFLTKNKFHDWVKKLAADGIVCWYFEDIIKQLLNEAASLDKSDDEIIQTLRIVNRYYPGLTDKKKT